MALSVRQPWAWMIVNGWKDVENRTWPTSFRGEVLIHAAGKMTRDEYAEGFDTFDTIVPAETEVIIPRRQDMELGGIVGAVTITDCVDESESPWFSGPYGFLMTGARKLPFVVVRGQLGFFRVEYAMLKT